MNQNTKTGAPIWRRGLLLLALSLIAGACWGEPVRIGGTGSGSALLERLAQEYKRTDPSADVRIIMPPLGSSGGLRALSAAEIDLAVVGRALKPEEAALPGLGRGFEYVKTPFVLATSAPQASGLSLLQLEELYAGRLARWPDGSPIRLILRSRFESDTALLRSFSPGMSAAIDSSYERKGMTIADNDIDALDLLVKTPNSFGPTTLGLMRVDGRSLTALRLDGAEPSLKTLSSGAYRWAKSIHLITAATVKPGTQKFLAFLHSDRARRMLAETDFLMVSTWTAAASTR